MKKTFAIFHYAMALIYISVGAILIFSDLFPMINGSIRCWLAVIVILYGIYRFYYTTKYYFRNSGDT